MTIIAQKKTASSEDTIARIAGAKRGMRLLQRVDADVRRRSAAPDPRR